MAATDEQVQVYVNTRFRTYAEKVRSAYILAKDHKLAIDDVYDACEPPESATWTDERDDGPPHLLTAQDVLSFNAWISNFADIIDDNLVNDAAKIAAVNSLRANWATMMKACVQAPEV